LFWATPVEEDEIIKLTADDANCNTLAWDWSKAAGFRSLSLRLRKWLWAIRTNAHDRRIQHRAIYESCPFANAKL
jgi:hypothetical protein